MLFRRIIIRLRITLTILLFLGVIAVIGGVFYLNSTGLNEEIRGHISDELEQRGVHVEFDSLKYHFSDGLVATNVQFFDSEDRINKLASLPEVSINLDKTKLLRGIRKINSLSLTNTDIEIPINPEDPNSPRMVIKDINGNIEFPSNDSISTSKLTACYMGINITLAGNLWQEVPQEHIEEPPKDIAITRALAYQKFLNYLQDWTWDESTTPQVNLFVEGDINAPQNIKLEFDIDAPALAYQGYALKEVKSTGNLTHNLITVDKLEFSNKNKKAHVMMDYDLTLRDGRFDILTGIHIQEFVKNLFGYELIKGFKITGGMALESNGRFKLPNSEIYHYFSPMLPDFIKPEVPKLELQATGTAKLSSFEYLGSKFDSFSSDFSWNNGDIYLDRLIVKNNDGFLKGRLLYKNKIITYDTETTFSADTFRPFIKPGGKVDKALEQIEFAPDSTLLFKSTGNINAKDLTDWESDGEFYLTKVQYNDISIDSLNSKFRWIDSALSGNITVLETKFKDLSAPSINSQFLWTDNVITGDITLLKPSFKDLSVNSLSSRFKWADNQLSGNLTLIDTHFKDLSSKQLDSSFIWQDGIFNTKINLTKPKLKSAEFDSLSATIQYKDNQIAVADIIAKHPSGSLTGNVFTSKDYIHYDVISTADPYLYIPLLKSQGLVDFLSTIKVNEKSKHYITARGQLNKKNRHDFHAEGEATLNNLVANGVEVDSVKSEYRLNGAGFLMENSRLVFDYKNYDLHKLFKGSSKGEATVSQAYVNTKEKTVTLKDIKARAHPAPIARMFHKGVADHLEEYQFYEPPTITASGVFDIVSRPIKDQKLTFKAKLSCPDFDTRYKILDGNLLFRNFSADVNIIKNQVNVEKIRTHIFGNGIAQGNLAFTIPDEGLVFVSGDANWQNIDFKKVGITYNFDEIPKGKLRGNIQFSGRGDDISSYNTKTNTMGTFALENGDLVSIPVLGPVSSIINPFISPLAGKNAMNERLKDISARFRLVKGVLITDDIQSLTPSLTFFGEGTLNLNNDQVDVTIRVNYRGLLGKAMELGGELIKLPIKALRAVFLNKKPAEIGLIQVRGRGHYKDSSWKLVPFDPPRNFDIPLFKPGKALEIPQAKPVE